MPTPPLPTPQPQDDLVPIPIRVSRARKAEWIRRSKQAGQRLTDWIVERVERDDAPPMPGHRKD